MSIEDRVRDLERDFKTHQFEVLNQLRVLNELVGPAYTGGVKLDQPMITRQTKLDEEIQTLKGELRELDSKMDDLTQTIDRRLQEATTQLHAGIEQAAAIFAAGNDKFIRRLTFLSVIFASMFLLTIILLLLGT